VSGPKKSAVLLQSGLQADLRVVGPESYGAALVYFTGDKRHNIELRRRAIHKGWKLNEYGLFDAEGRALAGEDEEGVYRALGLALIPPEERHGAAEFDKYALHGGPE
jgi:DNA polymerase (family 10)